MTDTPIYAQTLARNCLRMSDDTLALLANKLDENTYTIRTAGGDLSLTDKEGLLSYLKNLEKGAGSGGVELERRPVGGTGRRGRGSSLRQSRGMDHVRNPDAAA